MEKRIKEEFVKDYDVLIFDEEGGKEPHTTTLTEENAEFVLRDSDKYGDKQVYRCMEDGFHVLNGSYWEEVEEVEYPDSSPN